MVGMEARGVVLLVVGLVVLGLPGKALMGVTAGLVLVVAVVLLGQQVRTAVAPTRVMVATVLVLR